MRVTENGSNVASSSQMSFRKLAVPVSGRRGKEKTRSPCTVHATRDRKQSLPRKRDDGVGSKFVFATVTVRSGVPSNQSPAACFTVEPFSRPFRTVLLGFYVFSFCALRSSALFLFPDTRHPTPRNAPVLLPGTRHAKSSKNVRRRRWRNTSAIPVEFLRPLSS